MKKKAASYLLPSFEMELDDIKFRIAITPEDYLAAFNLVYKIFIQEGYARPGRTPFRLAPQHCNHNSRVFMGFIKNDKTNQLIYSLSVFPDSENGLPMDTEFAPVLNHLREQGRFLVEAGHLAAEPQNRNNMNIPMLGNKMLYHYATDHLQADDIVITIHPKHKWFYENLLLFETIGEIDTYAYANNNPALAMRLDLKTCEEKYYARYKKSAPSKNLYNFFFINESSSITLPPFPYHFNTQFLDQLKTFYGMNL